MFNISLNANSSWKSTASRSDNASARTHIQTNGQLENIMPPASIVGWSGTEKKLKITESFCRSCIKCCLAALYSTLTLKYKTSGIAYASMPSCCCCKTILWRQVSKNNQDTYSDKSIHKKTIISSR